MRPGFFFANTELYQMTARLLVIDGQYRGSQAWVTPNALYRGQYRPIKRPLATGEFLYQKRIIDSRNLFCYPQKTHVWMSLCTAYHPHVCQSNHGNVETSNNRSKMIEIARISCKNETIDGIIFFIKSIYILYFS